ncbi:MAG: hypothetical protein QXL51_05005 [Candidatus Aenigmatarchaeota archaeon]
MIDKQKLQEVIYKYEELIKNKELYRKGKFTEAVFRELGIEEDETNEIKENYCKKDSQKFNLELTKKELTKKILYILQILPFQAAIHYYKIDLQKFLDYVKSNLTLNKHHKNNYNIGISFDEEYKYITFPDYSLLEYINDLKYNNPSFEELDFDSLEDIQKELLRKENISFEEYPSNTPGKDIKINNIIVELKATKSINLHNNNTSSALHFCHTRKKIASYFLFSYIFEDEQNMLNIIMKNYNYNAEDIEIFVPKEFYNIANDTSLTDEEKIEKLKDIPIEHKGIKLKFYTTKEVKEFFDNL